jgi:acetoin utilization protein AcuB
MTQAHRSSASQAQLGETPIRMHMSSSPACIAGHRTLADAWRIMQDHHVRHLPVLEGGAVVGMISQRDLGVLGTQAPARLNDLRVDEAMSGEPYVVSPEAPLRSVVSTLSTRRIGAAIVVEHGEVQGVFTTTDVLAILRNLLEGAVSL